MPDYREKLWPTPWIYLSSLLLVPASILVLAPVSMPAGIATGVILYAAVAGALKSPYENRAAVILLKVQRGWEGPPHTVEFQIAGADLIKGFKK